jgi:hypothetical protein
LLPHSPPSGWWQPPHQERGCCRTHLHRGGGTKRGVAAALTSVGVVAAPAPREGLLPHSPPSGWWHQERGCCRTHLHRGGGSPRSGGRRARLGEHGVEGGALVAHVLLEALALNLVEVLGARAREVRRRVLNELLDHVYDVHLPPSERECISRSGQNTLTLLAGPA